MNDLLSGWQITSTSEACALVQSGGTPKAGFVASAGIPFLKVYNIVDQNIRFEYKPQFVAQDVHEGELRKSKIRPGDVLMNIVGPPLGKVAIVPDTYPEWNANQALTIFRPSAVVSTDWLYYFLCGGSSVQSVINDTRGSAGQVNISLSQCRNFEIPLPPPAEQQRIVAKIHSLTGKSRRARDRLDHIPRLVEKYKQAILAAAFRGDLTRAWRLQNHESGNWRHTNLGEVVSIASGQTPKGIETKLAADGDLPWFKVSSMNDPENIRGFTTSKFRLSRIDARNLGLKVAPAGSIAFPKRGGAIATNKKRRLLVDGALDLNIMVLTPTGVSGEFLWWWLQKLDLSTISNGSNVPQINNGDVAPLKIALPSIAEQAQISKLIEAAFMWIDRLCTESVSARKLIDHLDQAVLAKALKGELVPQDSADEPASILLDRIRAERAAAAKAKRGRKETA
ncbi:restriction endonuclease subunit S [Pseudomonas pergaminensis]